MKLQNLLNEKTFAIGGDVDILYNKGFKKVLNVYKKKSTDEFVEFILKNYNTAATDRIFYVGDSSILKSKQCKKAHEVNPVQIVCGILSGHNYYEVKKKIISLSLHSGVFDLLKQTRDINKVGDVLPTSQLNRFSSEFTSTNIKATIYHELSHWLSDSLYNQNLTKRIGKWNETGDKKHLLGKHEDVNYTDFEADAQVHAIKQIKRDHNKYYDDLEWKDLFTMKPALHSVWEELINSLGRKKEKFFRTNPKNRETQAEWSKIEKKHIAYQKKFFKDFTKRLHREGLLNKNLQKFPKRWDLT